MAERSPNDPRRVSSLETGMSDVVRNLNPRDTIAQPGSVIWPKMAYTDYGPDGIYPSPGVNPNTYWIKFVDATFDDSTAGLITRTVTGRQVVARALVQNIASDYIPRESLIGVWPQNNRFWTFFRGSGNSSPMLTIPFKNDSGEIAPKFGVMQVKEVAVDGIVATVDATTDEWTLAAAQTWATGERVKFTTTGTPPTTSPAGGLSNGAIVYTRMVSTTVATLHPTSADAIADTNVINCTDTGTGTHKLAKMNGASEYLVIQKPDPSTTSYPPYLFVVNGSSDVANGAMGRCTHLQCSYDYPVRALYDPTEWDPAESPNKPAMFDALGPKKNSWKLSRRRHGFIVLGNTDNNAGINTVTVIQRRTSLHVTDDNDFMLCGNPDNEHDIEPYAPVQFGGIANKETNYGWPAVYDGEMADSLTSWNKQFGIVSADGCSHRQGAQMTLAVNRPFWARYEKAQWQYTGTNRPTSGMSFGFFPGTDKLYAGLPGFICVNYRVGDDDSDVILVMRDTVNTRWMAQAYADWADTDTDGDASVLCNPYDRVYGHAYDGSLPAWPELKMKIMLPRCGQDRDPCVFEGQKIYYAINGAGVGITGKIGSVWRDGRNFISAIPHLDDRIGTVKIWLRAISDIPKGWRECTGLQDRFPLGVSSSGTAPAVAATGGTKTHTHGQSAGFGTSGTTQVLNSANHMPPYYGVYFIERYK